MDEPCSALDPIATGRIEELIGELGEVGYTRDIFPTPLIHGPRPTSPARSVEASVPSAVGSLPLMSNDETRTQFHSLMDEVRSDLVHMGALVIEGISAVIGRFYERIGDHAVNIGERVQYLVTGELPEHAGAQRARARREAESAG